MLSKSHRIPYSWQRKPLLPEMKLLMKDFGFKNTTPKIGTSHGRLRDFSSELTKNYPPQIGTSHRGLRAFCSELLKITPPPPKLLFGKNFREKLQYHKDNWAEKGCVHPKCVYADLPRFLAVHCSCRVPLRLLLLWVTFTVS